MSNASSVQKGDFDLNVVSLRKSLMFPDGTIQDTAYTGDGSEDLAEVLAVGNNASNQDILGVRNLQVNTQIQLTPAGNSVNFNGEINQVNLGLIYSGNQLQPTLITSNVGQSVIAGLVVTDNTGTDGINILPNAPNNAFNPLVNANDISIVARSPTQSLSIVPDSATTCGIRITDTDITIGSGGVADTPTANIVFNNPANTIKATTTAGFQVLASSIYPTPTLSVGDVPTGRYWYFNPTNSGGQYNPMDTANNIEMIAWGSAGINTQTAIICPHSSTTCGIKMSGGSAGDASQAFCQIGCGGTSSNPSQSIFFSQQTQQIQMSFGALSLSTGALPNTSGSSAGVFLPVIINGVAYKIALLNS